LRLRRLKVIAPKGLGFQNQFNQIMEEQEQKEKEK
jgi:hypothetical protein